MSLLLLLLPLVLCETPPVTISFQGASSVTLLINTWASLALERSGGIINVEYTPTGSGAGVAFMEEAAATHEAEHEEHDDHADEEDEAVPGEEVDDHEGHDHRKRQEEEEHEHHADEDEEHEDEEHEEENHALIAMSDIPAYIPHTLHLPSALIGIALFVHNEHEGEVTHTVRMTPQMLAAVLQGHITKWSDPQIVALNRADHLPEGSIITLYRSDSSGSTAVLTQYLDMYAGSVWTGSVGTVMEKGTWSEASSGVHGSDYMIHGVGALGGALGYSSTNGLVRAEHITNIELLVNDTAYASPSPAAIYGALQVRSVNLPDRHESFEAVNILGGDVVDGIPLWPISSLSYILSLDDFSKAGHVGCATKAFLQWISAQEAQYFASRVGLTPLPESLLQGNREAIDKIIVTDDDLVAEYLHLLTTRRVTRTT